MAKGAVVKEKVAEKIKEAFGKDFLGECDKKYYVQAEEAGEMVQVAIALTCPKTAITVGTGPVIRNGVLDFTVDAPVLAPAAADVEITQEERDNINEMMRRLCL